MGMPNGTDKTILEIVNLIENGEYRIPRFQRDFVWEIKKSAALIDSILRGYPIGSVIVWETKSKLTCIGKKDLGGISIPGRDTGRYISYIIDGQQRLTSLFMAIKGLTTGRGQDFSKIVVSLTASGDEQIVYDSLPKDADTEDFISLKDLYEHKSSKKYPDVVNKYNQILFQYHISVIELDDEQLGLEQVVDIFERLNLGGKKLNMFSIVAARCYFPETDEDDGFDLTQKLEALNRYLKEQNYGTIADSTFLQSIAACLIGKVKKSDILKSLKDKQIRENYEAVEKAIYDAIQHLTGSDYGAVVSSLLPYERIIVPFVYFHYHHKKKQISAFQEKYLKDYFWRCVITKRFNNAADDNTNADLIRIKDILNNKKPDQFSVMLSPKSIFENGKFTLTSGYVLGILCIMAQRSPKSLAEGRVIPITDTAVSKAAKKQYHHFFPKQSDVILSNNEYKRAVNNVVNIVFMDAVTNNQIKNMNPSRYIKKFSKGTSKLAVALKTHYISKSGFGIEDDDFFVFLNARSYALYTRLRDLLAIDRHDMISEELPFEQ